MKRNFSEVYGETVVDDGCGITVSLDDVEMPLDFKERHMEKFGDAVDVITKLDPSLVPVFLKGDFVLFKKQEPNYKPPTVDTILQSSFSKLGGAIVGQQISNAAARSIRNKFMNLFEGIFPSFKVLNEYVKEEDNKIHMKEVGLSQRKIMYLESLASYFTNNEQKLGEMFLLDRDEHNDQEIIDDLVDNIKGIGPWTAKMFLVTGLRRYNVFAPEDVGVARGFAKYVSDKPELVNELMQDRQVVKKSKIKHKNFNWKIYDIDIMERCAERFAPYKTVFMFLLWRLSDTGKVNISIEVENQFVNSL